MAIRGSPSRGKKAAGACGSGLHEATFRLYLVPFRLYLVPFRLYLGLGLGSGLEVFDHLAAGHVVVENMPHLTQGSRTEVIRQILPYLDTAVLEHESHLRHQGQVLGAECRLHPSHRVPFVGEDYDTARLPSADMLERGAHEAPRGLIGSRIEGYMSVYGNTGSPHT